MRSRRRLWSVLVLLVAGAVLAPPADRLASGIAYADGFASGIAHADRFAGAAYAGPARDATAPAVHDPTSGADLETSDVQPTTAPHQIAYRTFIGATTVKKPRRSGSARFHAPLRPVQADPVAATRHTRLRLRAALRDALATRAALERTVTGAASFHTNTPPPRPFV